MSGGEAGGPLDARSNLQVIMGRRFEITQRDVAETPHDWGPRCKVRILEGRRIQLREEPRSGSLRGGVAFGERDPITVMGWDVVNGYIRVRASRAGFGRGYAQGWIRIKHVLAWDDRRFYRALGDESWYGHHWKVTTSDTSVWVTRGGRRWDEIADELVHMGLADKEERKHLRQVRDMVMAEGYTYIALSLGHPYRENDWEVCSDRCHISVAYAAIMHEGDMAALRGVLMGVLEQWQLLPPMERPEKLTRCRKFMTLTKEEARPRRDDQRGLSGSYTKRTIAELPWRVIQKMITERRIDTIDVEREADLPEFIRRCWERDVRRIEDARERARKLDPHQGTLDLVGCDHGLGFASHEMSDLLLYIGDAIRHWASASTRAQDEQGLPTGPLIRPYVVDERSWHVSRQGDWECTRTFSSKD